MTRLTRLGLACLALLAVSLLGAAGASATAKLDLTWNGEANQLKPGEPFEMVLYHWSEAAGVGPNTFTVTTNPGTAGQGTITCTGTEYPFSGLGGVDVTNNAVTDKVKMEATATGALFGGTSCPNTTGLGAEAHVYLYPEEGTLSLTGYNGKAALKEKSKEAPMYLADSYSGGAYCLYKIAKLGGTEGTLKLENYGSGTTWKQLVISFTKQAVSFVAASSSAECPKKANVTGSFGFQDKGGEPEFGDGFFIFGHLD